MASLFAHVVPDRWLPKIIRRTTRLNKIAFWSTWALIIALFVETVSHKAKDVIDANAISKLFLQIDSDTKAIIELGTKQNEFQKHASPRQLSEEQKRLLVSALSRFPKTKVHVMNMIGDVEGQAFASDFIEVFNKSNWEIIDFSSSSLHLIGVSIAANDSQGDASSWPAGGKVLSIILANLDIIKKDNNGKIPITGNPGLSPDEFMLMIGAKER